MHLSDFWSGSSSAADGPMRWKMINAPEWIRTLNPLTLIDLKLNVLFYYSDNQSFHTIYWYNYNVYGMLHTHGMWCIIFLFTFFIKKHYWDILLPILATVLTSKVHVYQVIHTQYTSLDKMCEYIHMTIKVQSQNIQTKLHLTVTMESYFEGSPRV